MKKYRSTLIILLSVVTVIVTLYGCGKAATENKLLGRWTKINVDNLADTLRVEEWEFLGAPDIRIYFSQASSGDTSFLEGTYTMKSSREFTVSGSGNSGWPLDANGNWRIVKLKKGSLIIVREDGGLTFREFRQI